MLAGDGEPPEPAESAEPVEPAREYLFDLLDVMEGMSNHFHEHHADILRWSWKLFCAKWARMLDQVSKREAERLAKEQERQEEQMLRELMAANRAQAGLG